MAAEDEVQSWLRRKDHLTGKPCPAAFTLTNLDGVKAQVAFRGSATLLEVGDLKWDKDQDEVVGKLREAQDYVPFIDFIGAA